MKRLRHPIRAIQEPFGKAGLTVAILALVLAMVGGAYAAGGLTKSQEKQVKKIAKKYAGKPGATGPAGAAGTNGTNGTNGSGTPGSPGANGKTVLHGAGAPSAGTGTEGDFYIDTAADKIYGPKVGPGTWGSGTELKGEPGETGFTETLPKGSTETGVWSVQGDRQEFNTEVEGNKHTVSIGRDFYTAPISFPIPLAQAPTAHYIPPGTPAAGEGELTEHSKLVKNLTTSSGNFFREAVISGAGIPAGTTIKNCLGATNEPLDRCEGAAGLELSAEATTSGTEVELRTAPPEGCAGNVSQPEAEEGNLCVFAKTEQNASPYFGFIDFIDPATEAANSAGTLGTLVVRSQREIRTVGSGTSPMEAFGTWAVTSSE